MPDISSLKKFHDCCRTIVKNSDKKALNYCINYAKYGLYLQDREAARVQSLYILNNMIYWRGPEAKKVRSFLKEFSKS